jgi:hypothetical protein
MRTAQLRGLAVTTVDLDVSDAIRLFVPPAVRLPPGAARYVRYGEKQRVHRAAKCAERDPWFVPLYLDPPDGFLSSMAWGGPRFVLNHAGAVCTNTLLGVRFQPEVERARREALSAGALSTVAQLSAEIEGRVCGGGLLKIEPSDASRLVIPPVVLDPSRRAQLDALVRAARLEEAQTLVDSELDTRLEMSQLHLLRRALEQLRARRKARGRRARPSVSLDKRW